MISYQKFTPSMSDEIFELYNKNAGDFYEKITSIYFFNNFIHHPEFDPNGVFVAVDNNKIIGFIACHVRHIEKDDITKPGYLTTILVDKSYRRNKIGTTLLSYVKNYLKGLGKTKIAISYLSTLNWPWIINKENNFDHNGAPGAKVNSDIYLFLLNNHFEVIDHQDAFCLELSKFNQKKEVIDNLNALLKEDIKIELYDKNKHFGLDEFYLDINSEPFERVIKENLNKENPMPFAVISKGNKIVGWTGAFYTEASGRAHFDGIVIAPCVRGKGLGKALFSFLAEYSKTHGSRFMSFFTGRTNFARYIYLGLGFKIIASFAIMESSL